MAFVNKDNVRQTSSSSGTGVITLDGVVFGRQKFSDVMSIGDTCWVGLRGSGYFQSGLFTYTGVNTLTRTVTFESTNSGADVNFPAGGTIDVIMGLPASRATPLSLQSIVSAGLMVTSSVARAFAVGRQGYTDPALSVDASASSSVTGLAIRAAALAGGLFLSVLSPGVSEPLYVDAKGSGQVVIGANSTGAISLMRAASVGGNLIVSGDGYFYRSATTGYSFYGSNGTKYFGYDGANFQLVGGTLVCGAINTQNGAINAGSGGITVGAIAGSSTLSIAGTSTLAAINCTTVNLQGNSLSNGNLNVNGYTVTASTFTGIGNSSIAGQLAYGSLSGGGITCTTVNAQGNTVSCGGITCSTINTQGNSITCAAINTQGNTISCGGITCTNINLQGFTLSNGNVSISGYTLTASQVTTSNASVSSTLTAAQVNASAASLSGGLATNVIGTYSAFTVQFNNGMIIFGHQAPGADNTFQSGVPGQSWNSVYSYNYPSPSDARKKATAANDNLPLLYAAIDEVENHLFRWRHDRDRMGDAAPLNYGPYAQEIWESLRRHGLRPESHDIVRHDLVEDSWDLRADQYDRLRLDSLSLRVRTMMSGIEIEQRRVDDELTQLRSRVRELELKLAA